MLLLKATHRRNHVDESETLVRQRGLDERNQLPLVAGETPRHEAGADLQGHGHEVDGFVEIGHALLAGGAQIVGGGNCPLVRP